MNNIPDRYSFLGENLDGSPVAVTDPMGLSPVYYLDEPGPLKSSFASYELIKAHGSRELDESYIGRFLAGGYSISYSGFTGIRCLPPGCVLQVVNGKPEVTSYWQPASAEKHYQGLEDAIARFRALWRSRLMGSLEGQSDLIGIHLSGGLDSTLVTITVTELCREMGIADPVAFTWMAAPTAETENHPEHRFVHELATGLNLELHYCPVNRSHLLEIFQQDYVGRAFHSTIYHELPVMQTAQRLGVARIFSGWGGDEGLSYRGAGYLAELLRSGQWVTWLQQIRTGNGWRNARSRMISSLAEAVLGETRLDFLRRGLKRRGADSFAIESIKESKVDIPNYASSRDRQRFFFHQAGYIQHRVQCYQALAARYGLIYDFPYLDPDVVDFAVSLPRQFLADKGKNRVFMREFLRGKVNDQLRNAKKLNDAMRTNDLRNAIMPLMAEFYRLFSSSKPQRAVYLDWQRFLASLKSFGRGENLRGAGKLCNAVQFLDDWSL